MRQTTMPRALKNAERRWFVLDAAGKPVGRVAAEAVRILKGKYRPTYLPFLDMGDYVIVINAEKAIFTGRKWEQKYYYHHSGYEGGLRLTRAKDMLREHPTRILEHAIKGMLPKNPLGRQMGRKLFVYAGPDHPHEAQRPVLWEGPQTLLKGGE
ncbi:MAG: 50S ribosomal protein L13 [Firmicutes bacterium]|nr:50S ribosomal protein L13 [Bacillota bacterium]